MLEVYLLGFQAPAAQKPPPVECPAQCATVFCNPPGRTEAGSQSVNTISWERFADFCAAQVRLAKVLEGRAYDAAVHAEPHAAEALDKMRMGDYLQLGLTHRFAILNLLINIALTREMLRCARPIDGQSRPST